MLKSIITIACLCSLLAQPARAQDTTMTRLLRANVYPLTAAKAQLSGTGWERLQASIAKSQFVLVGEDHGMAQIPQFTQAVARELQPAAFITEIDRYQAGALTRLTATPGPPTAYLKASPGALSFFSWEEEYELAQQLRAQKAQIIGIEQVGVFTPGRFFEQLANQVRSKTTRIYLQQRRVVYQQHDNEQSRSGGHAYSMVIQHQSALDSLVAITKSESPEVRRMVQEYLLSYLIYKDQVKGLDSHQARVNLMKRNLLEALRPLAPQPGQPLPRLLFKFGASHMARMLSPWAGITDVGNLAQNLADVQDARSLHLLVMGRQGTQVGGFNPDDPSKNVVPFDISKETYLKPFADITTGPAWQVFDLRPARRALLNDKLKLTDQMLVALLLGYDYFILIPNATASHS
ncbi:hypothetical protein ACFP2F_09565 [Hymenobacter artigasi]|uniref:Haem-binding uptake Tiki superfamily ChaN domain-containing protein n=1 Tax=Hymenobacter artigasi TaxID=2719616 RepID=A0ABX1HLI7_9BACT|nr:hypothetical protein [Hymenobacter artigasi]NKI90002.1 hypothetical protein [Hymenobacter artigasi]